MTKEIAIALCLIPAAACGIVEGLATGKAVEAIARNPEAADRINSLLILGLALTESSSIYGFVIALIMLFR
ncbi:MAG: ATP synthase F0 subunit C [bacterium]|jgi:F-type H+-transporting ATPase subunit c